MAVIISERVLFCFVICAEDEVAVGSIIAASAIIKVGKLDSVEIAKKKGIGCRRLDSMHKSLRYAFSQINDVNIAWMNLGEVNVSQK